MDVKFYFQLLEIVKVLTKIRGKTYSYTTNDFEFRNSFDQSNILKEFSVNNETYNSIDSTIFKLYCTSIYDNGLIFGSQCCSMNVCFESAWFLNFINHHEQTITLNNMKNAIINIAVDKDYNCIKIKDENITEEWIFQLMTLHDIPSYENFLLLNEIRKSMMQYNYPFSFSLAYNSEENLKIFLDKIQEFLNAQN